MPTLVLDPPPADFQALLERRRRIGADRRDEVWKGVLHMTPAPSAAHARLAAQVLILLAPSAAAAGLEPSTDFNLGAADEYRVPDGGLLPRSALAVYLATVPLVVEIVSLDDQTSEKAPFYAAHHVDELLIVDAQERSVRWLALEQAEYRPIERSGLVDLGRAELEEQLDWPARDDS
ncbi:MAG: Uma2 family endonuclease [Solirubrobacteraceae bacterium]